MPGVKRTRRVKGEGSIFRNEAKGYWVGRYTHLAGGLRRRHEVTGKTRAEVSEKLRVLRETLRKGQDPSRRSSPTIRAIVATWLEDVQRTRRPATFERYTQVAAHVLRAVGDVRLIDVTADTVRLLDATLVRKKATTAARLDARIALTAVLGIATREGKLARNPVTDVPPPTHVAKRVLPLTAEEARMLIRAAAGERIGALYILAVTAGLRLGELFGLKWADVDLRNRVLRVERSLREVTRDGSGVIENEPKTAAGVRTVLLTALATRALTEHLASLPKASAKARSAYVFTADKGGPLRKSVFRRKTWLPFLERHGLPSSWTMRQLRHTASTLFAEAGAHPRFVMDLLGHTTTEQTMGTYTHTSRAMQTQAIDALDALLGGPDRTAAEVGGGKKKRP